MTLALAVGAASHQVAVPTAVLGSVLMYSGGAYLVALTMIGEGAAPVAVLAAVLVVNLRFSVYSAALSTKMQDHPLWMGAAITYFLAEPVSAYLDQVDQREARNMTRVRLIVIVGLGWSAWQVAFLAGALAGPALAAVAPTNVLSAALFIGILVPGMKSSPAIVAAAASAAVMVTVVGIVGVGGLFAAGAVGMVAGVATRRLRS